MKRIALTLALASLAMGGCATKEYVHEYVGAQLAPVTKRVETLEGQTGALDKRVSAAEAALKADGDRIAKNEADIAKNTADIAANTAAVAEASRTASEALERATVAGKLAEGRLLYEVVLTDDSLKFRVDSATLTDDAKKALDAFAEKLKADNQNVYIEVQGHTDSRGEEAANLRLGEARANSVMRYLNMKGGIALHRMAAISYGESAPVADNMVKAGRQQNRRVVLVVLK